MRNVPLRGTEKLKDVIDLPPCNERVPKYLEGSEQDDMNSTYIVHCLKGVVSKQ